MSAKRNFVLKSVLNGKPHLKSLCETKWTDRHDSIAIFKSSMSDIIEALTNISEWNELDSSSKAKTLLTAMCTCEFIISINALSNILCVTAPISRILQGIDNDILAAFECIQNVVTILENMPTNCDTVFKQIFEESCLLMKDFEIEVKTPRLSKRQTQRSNHPSETTEDFYRVSLFIPLVENVLKDLKSRFLSKQNQTVTILSQLIPKFIVDVNDEKIDSIVSIMKNGYRFDDDLLELLEESQLKSEIQLLKEKWKSIKNEGGDVIKYALTAIDQCNGILYPNIKTILYIIACLPTTVASAERSFSTLRRLKTWLRSNMGQDRLVGLALLNIHRNRDIQIDEVIDMFAATKKKKY
ncbi:52 kDa repressor of the inhibitor of the protein kinase-like [Rhopalosiphum padi]|uniref:52 kDa repressor of the inhibitor of the protein kinase-like n=1 Tax=Rhopalosiphum padi TaxID=40932 RepID=UPI00298DD0CC|nr:52 kDa repressor of the inhibitor of the protein kinase-like [Rhopalosiphum padi]